MGWSPHPGRSGPRAHARLDWPSIGRWVPLAGHAMRRHSTFVLLTWFGIVALSIGSMAVLPKTYEVQALITSQLQAAETIPALGSGARPLGTEDPNNQAADVVLRHDNLVALVRETHLLKNWPLHRAPLLKLKDAIWAVLFKPLTEEQQIEAFVGLLRDRFSVTTQEGAVTIGIRFADAELAFQLVEAAVANFLKARQTSEISSIGEAISLLETRSTQARESLDAALGKLQALRGARAVRLGRHPGGSTQPRLSLVPDREASLLLAQVQNKRQALDALEDVRRRRVTELTIRLQELQHLGPHPAVSELAENLEKLRQESPQATALRQDLAPLETRLKFRGYFPDRAGKSNRDRDSAVGDAAPELDDPHEELDPDIAYAMSRGRHALARYNGMLDRLASARLEQDTARAAFKYRYIVTWPPERPRRSIKPTPSLIIVASLIAGLVVANIGAALIEIYSRKLVEPWQVEQAMGVPLLGEIRIL